MFLFAMGRARSCQRCLRQPLHISIALWVPVWSKEVRPWLFVEQGVLFMQQDNLRNSNDSEKPSEESLNGPILPVQC